MKTIDDVLNQDEIKRIKDFKKELGKLTDKYKLAIGGCGCCNSPYIYDILSKKYLLGNISYNEEDKEYFGDGEL